MEIYKPNSCACSTLTFWLLVKFNQFRQHLTVSFVGADDCGDLGLGDAVNDAVVAQVGVQRHDRQRVLEDGQDDE